MLMPYLPRYRLSSWRSRVQGKLAQPTQYAASPLAILSHVLILHLTQ